MEGRAAKFSKGLLVVHWCSHIETAGAERVFVDHGDSSRIRNRPQWLAALDYMRAGETLLVHRLDRDGVHGIVARNPIARF